MDIKDFPDSEKETELRYNRVVRKRNGVTKKVICQIPEHRLIWFLHYGWLPNADSGYTLDHINRDPTDNRIENLRLADAYQQAINRTTTNKTGYTGVTFDRKRNKWEAEITPREGRVKLGRHDSPQIAAVARDLGYVFYLSEEDLPFLSLNFPSRMEQYSSFCAQLENFERTKSVKSFMNAYGNH